MKQHPSNRKIIDLRPSQQGTSSTNPIKKSIFFSEGGLQLDVRTCIDMQRNKLKYIDKSTVKKIVSHAERKLMKLLKSKEAVNCLKEKQNSQPFYFNFVKTNHHRNTLFDQDKLERVLTAQKKKYREHVHTFTSPLLEYCQRQTQNGDKIRKYVKLNSTPPKRKQQYCKLSSCQKNRGNKWF